jgi:hypothetical protein
MYRKDVCTKRESNRTHIFRSVHTLHNPVEGEGLEQREHEQRTEEYVIRTVNRESWVTKQGLSTLSSEMFHGLSPLEFHGVVGESLEPCFAGIEPHAPALCDKVPKSQQQTRFKIDKRGKVRLLSAVG